MTTHLEITTGRTAGGAPHLTAVGEIDLTNAAQFTARLREAVSPEARLLVDLTRVDYIDSAGLAALFAHARQIEVHIAPLNEALLTFSGLDQLTTVQVIAVNPPAE
jgi:anti-sigma B factor antagonist